MFGGDFYHPSNDIPDRVRIMIRKHFVSHYNLDFNLDFGVSSRS